MGNQPARLYREFVECFRWRHATRCAVLLGKGPSLDLYSDAKAPYGAYVMGINEVPAVRPCNGVLYIHRRFDNFPYPTEPTFDIFRTVHGALAHDGRGWMFECSLYVTINQIAKREDLLYRCPGGSTGFALALLGQCEIRRIDMWGYDAMMEPPDQSFEHAACLKDVVISKPCARTYPAMTQGILKTIERFAFDARLMPWGITPPPPS